jgi:hypothetical protein
MIHLLSLAKDRLYRVLASSEAASEAVEVGGGGKGGKEVQKHILRRDSLIKTRKIGCYFIVIKIKEKRRCQFKNNTSSYCRSSPSSGQDSN